MNPKYDMIVIGAGSGGLSMGLGLHELGLKVLLVDKSDENIGGECLNNGCVPSKTFIHISKIIKNSFDGQKYGLNVDGAVSLKKVWESVRNAQEKIRNHENAAYFKSQGLDIVLGPARFVGKTKIEVNGQVYNGSRITIATGSKPRRFKVPGIEQVDYHDNESIWKMEHLPAEMLFIGAGPINMELGQAFARLGTKVTMVEMDGRILPKESEEIAQILYERSVEMGIEFYLNSKVSRFTDSRTAVITNGSQEHTINCDAVLVGIGREISSTDLNLESAGIETNERGAILVDKYLRTSNKRVLVVGDASGGPQFSHAAELQATVLIKNLFTPFKSKVNYDHFSWVTFTDPEVATFGFSEERIKQMGKSYEKLVLDFTDDDRAVTSNYQYGKLILYTTKSRFNIGSAKLLGGSMIAPNAGEMIQELVLAQSAGLKIKSLFNKIHAYPTGARVNKTIVLNKYSASIRPWMTKILRLIY